MSIEIVETPFEAFVDDDGTRSFGMTTFLFHRVRRPFISVVSARYKYAKMKMNVIF